MPRIGTGKEIDGCPGNGCLTAAELFPHLLAWKNLQMLMLPIGIALLYLDARSLVMWTFEKSAGHI